MNTEIFNCARLSVSWNINQDGIVIKDVEFCIFNVTCHIDVIFKNIYIFYPVSDYYFDK